MLRKTLTSLLIFYVNLFVGGRFIGLIKYAIFDLAHYLSARSILTNVGGAILFTSVLVFFSPVFKEKGLFVKFFKRLACAMIAAHFFLYLYSSITNFRDVSISSIEFNGLMIFVVAINIMIFFSLDYVDGSTGSKKE